jgi:hypothetical protein
MTILHIYIYIYKYIYFPSHAVRSEELVVIINIFIYIFKLGRRKATKCALQGKGNI